MRVAVVSDIHANLAALQAVLADAGSVDALWCVGDVVGYGAEPNECVTILREAGAACVAGNHDLAALGRENLDIFNADAAAAARWTAAELTPESREWLAQLPDRWTQGPVTLAHGSPYDTVWEYVTSARVATRTFDYFDTAICFIGHTHLPSSFVKQPDGQVRTEYRAAGDVVRVGETRLLANSGSVGQPRDEDPRASYLIYDSAAGTLIWRRVTYPIEVTQTKILAAGLPPRLARRLAAGL